MAVKIRDLVSEDLPDLVILLNNAMREQHEFIPYTDATLQQRIQEGKLTVWVAEERGELIGSAAFSSGHWGEEIRWLAVQQRPDRKVVENDLVEEAEKQVKGQAISTSVDAGSEKINEWIERGFEPDGGMYQMLAKPNMPLPITEVPENFIIRNLRPEEEKEFVKAVNAGFGFERLKQNELQKWKADFPDFSEEWIFVAEFEKKIVSILVAKPDINYNRFFNAKRGYLGPATTIPEFRSKGLASILCCHAMNFLLRKGLTPFVLYTAEQNIASVTLLRKLGFNVFHHWKFMRKTLPEKTQIENLETEFQHDSENITSDGKILKR